MSLAMFRQRQSLADLSIDINTVGAFWGKSSSRYTIMIVVCIGTPGHRFKRNRAMPIQQQLVCDTSIP
jgi:hypothetical protein